jgi:hypothetical protein
MTLVDEQVAVEVIFRRGWSGESEEIPPGALVLAAAPPEDPHRRDLAQFVYHHHLAKLLKGEGKIRQMVMPAQPTLDDMLALEFVKRLLAGEQLPQGARLFAKYAKEARAGEIRHEDSAMPADESLKAIYMAVRHLDLSEDDSLEDEPAAARFLENWSRMAERIMQAAEEGVDPYSTPLFNDSEFARERAWVKSDHERYLDDVRRGERWIVSLPGAPRRSSALVLRNPGSRLFGERSRQDTATPTGEPYRLLGVLWPKAGRYPREWVFTTPRFLGPSLKPLYELLQSAADRKPGTTTQNSWVLRYNDTLLASYDSELSDDEVLRIAKRWARRRPLSTPEERFKAAMAACAMLAATLLAVLIAISLRLASQPTLDDPVALIDVESGDQEAPRVSPTPGGSGGTTSTTRKLTLDPGEEGSLPFRVSKLYDTNWQARFELTCTSSGTMPPDRVEIRAGGERIPVPSAQERFVTKPVTLQPKDNVIDVYLRNADHEQRTITVKLSCRRETTEHTLHVLAVGATTEPLKCPGNDARAITDFFRNCENPFFRVQVHDPLIDEEATFDNIVDTLGEIDGVVKREDVFLLFLAGHGNTRDDLYYFQPWDFQSDAPWAKQNAFTWADLVKYLPRCRAVVLLDTCHSGQGAADVDWLSKAGRECFVLAACAPDKSAYENNGHGHFTRAFLEGVGVMKSQRTDLVQKLHSFSRGVLTFKDLLWYLEGRDGRVSELSDGRQVVNYDKTKNADLEIPLMALPRDQSDKLQVAGRFDD